MKKKKQYRGIKYAMFPNTKQDIQNQKTFGSCRFVWNKIYDDRQEYYEKYKKSIQITPAEYKEEYEWLKEVDSTALSNTQLNLERAFQNFFKKKANFPKHKSKHKTKKSYTTSYVNNNIRLKDGYIKLPKQGWVKINMHKKPESNWKIKSATISQDKLGNYFVSVLFEIGEDEVTNIDKTEIKDEDILALDYKSNGLYHDSNNEVADMPHYFRQMEKKLAKEQKRLSRKKGSKKKEPKSKNYLKQLEKVNKIHAKIANQRHDYLHKQSTQIANAYDVVIVEDIDMCAIGNKGFHNGKATYDNGYGMFRNFLQYKLEERGKYFIKIDKWYASSQICSKCGNKQKLELKDRIYKWPKCGQVIDRDYNAALNIKAEGKRILYS